MIYTEMTKKAMQCAYEAHAGQVDRGGVPYIFHPYHLAEQMDDEISCAVALLHDVVEDTAVTIEDLEKVFPKAVTEAVAMLTHDPAIDYFDYVKAIKDNPTARKVKLADLNHNSDQSRVAGCDLPAEKLEALRGKYAKAKAILTGQTDEE